MRTVKIRCCLVTIKRFVLFFLGTFLKTRSGIWAVQVSAIQNKSKKQIFQAEMKRWKISRFKKIALPFDDITFFNSFKRFLKCYDVKLPWKSAKCSAVIRDNFGKQLWVSFLQPFIIIPNHHRNGTKFSKTVEGNSHCKSKCKAKTLKIYLNVVKDKRIAWNWMLMRKKKRALWNWLSSEL